MSRSASSSPLRLLPVLFVCAAVMLAGLASSATRGDPKPKGRAPQKKAGPKKPDKKAESPASQPEKKKVKVRWGKQRTESDEAYDKRYAGVLRTIKKDNPEDHTGGMVPLYTYIGKNSPFIVRTDIDAEFTANTVMYMEMLHREYGQAYSKLLGGVPSRIREPIEVVVYESRETYLKTGGSEGAGGHFDPYILFRPRDRGPHWKARHYRLVQFTSGVKDFAKWPKGVLKHEAAHMEIQMRLEGFWVDCPRWWNEGHAAVFEYWDFDKTVDENFAEIPNRGRYAPVIRRIAETDKWKDFHYIWTIDGESWHKDMTSQQGFLNYAQAWSLAAYMMNEGKSGRADFTRIFGLSKRVGADRKTNPLTGKRTIAWEKAFPIEDQRRMEENWTKWVKKNVAKDKAIPDEDYYLSLQGYDPKVKDKLVPAPSDVREKALKERERRMSTPNRIEK